jgi:uncharacterized protein DUF5666
MLFNIRKSCKQLPKGENMNLRGVVRIRLHSAAFGLVLALWLLMTGSELDAQDGSVGAQVRVRGKIVSLAGSELVVASANGNVKVTMADKTVIIGEVPIKFSEITPGNYLGTTATKQPDGSFLASEVHVLPENQRGLSEGHRPLSSAPESGATMTNGNVERVEDVTVQSLKGRMMAVKYKGGEVKVFIPPDIPVVKRVIGDRSLIKPGAELSVQGARGSDGSLTASEITVRARGA